jgi:hypothetical protein
VTPLLAAASERLKGWLLQPTARLELFRILAPLAILGFMSSRLIHADEWIGERGFRPPELGADWRQPLYLPSLPDNLAWLVAGVLLCSGLAVSAGWRARPAAVVFAVCLAFVALSDRLSAFTVSKLSPTLMLALALSPCGTRFGIDARRARQARPDQALPEQVGGATRFIQVLVPTIYSASGIAKLKGDWLSNPLVLWTHLHDSYQTAFSWLLANALPPFGWTVLQGATLVFEVGAPLWFSWRRTRGPALAAGLLMHTFIGLCFGPVKWFALLMGSLLVAGYLPAPALAWVSSRLARIEDWRPSRLG